MAGAVTSAFQGRSTQIKTPHWYCQYQQGKAQPELLLKHNYIAAYFPAERKGEIMGNLKKDNIRNEISAAIREIDNEEYLELIRRFAERLLDRGAE